MKHKTDCEFHMVGAVGELTGGEYKGQTVLSIWVGPDVCGIVAPPTRSGDLKMGPFPNRKIAESNLDFLFEFLEGNVRKLASEMIGEEIQGGGALKEPLQIPLPLSSPDEVH